MVGNKPHPLPTLMKCQKECDSNVKCNNIKFCAKLNKNDQVWELTCFLYDKVITKFAAQYTDNSNRTQEYNCSTKFKTCPGGMFISWYFSLEVTFYSYLHQFRIYWLVALHQLFFPDGCPKSVILTADKDPTRSNDPFGIYNLIKFDEYQNAVYKHNKFPDIYSLVKGNLTDGIRGWWVGI